MAFEAIINARKDLIGMLKLAPTVIPRDNFIHYNNMLNEIKTRLSDVENAWRVLYFKAEFPDNYHILIMPERRKEIAIREENYEDAEKVKKDLGKNI